MQSSVCGVLKHRPGNRSHNVNPQFPIPRTLRGTEFAQTHQGFHIIIVGIAQSHIHFGIFSHISDTVFEYKSVLCTLGSKIFFR